MNNLELFKVSYNAQKDYISKHIDNDINCLYFTSTCGHVLDMVDDAWTIDNLMYDLLVYSQSLNEFSKSGFFTNPRKYRHLAVQTALDICTSFKERFK